MALIGLDGFSETLTTAITSTDAVLPVSGGAALCLALGTNTSKLVITDGVYREVVKVTGCLTGLPQVLRGQEGTQARSFVAGSCVEYALLTSSICELIAAGGCAAVATCAPLNVLAGKFFSDVVSGLQYSHAIAWEGTAPFTVTVLQKPAWMTVSPVGGTAGTSLVMSGVAGAAVTGDFVQLKISNCGGTYETVQRLKYCAAVGAVV